MQGTVTVTERPGMTIHTYTSPADGLEASSHIVELATQLFVIDTQYALPYAGEAAEYAQTLGKPISRVYVSHEHPDHWFGSATFGAPVFALPSTKKAIQDTGDAIAANNHALVGNLVPDHAIVPTETVTVGEEVVDGVRFVFEEFDEVESASLLVISAPDPGVVFAQDLVYNHLHLFIAEGHLDGWADAVRSLHARGFEIVLGGHGAPGGPEQYAFVLDYLAAAQPLLEAATSPEQLKDALLDEFPDAGGAGLLDIQNGYIFARH